MRRSGHTTGQGSVGPGSRPSGLRYGAVFTLHVASHSGLPLLCDANTVVVGTGEPSADGAHSWDNGPALCCRPGSIHQLPYLLLDSGVWVSPDHPILYLPYLSWYPLAVREPGIFAVSSCSSQLFGSNAQVGESLFCCLLRAPVLLPVSAPNSPDYPPSPLGTGDSWAHRARGLFLCEDLSFCGSFIFCRCPDKRP